MRVAHEGLCPDPLYCRPHAGGRHHPPAKRDGGTLSRDEIRFFVSGVTTGELPDYQASALLMAVLLRGMSADETAWLTDAMVHSGLRLDLSDIPGVKVDKHEHGWSRRQDFSGAGSVGGRRVECRSR